MQPTEPNHACLIRPYIQHLSRPHLACHVGPHPTPPEHATPNLTEPAGKNPTGPNHIAPNQPRLPCLNRPREPRATLRCLPEHTEPYQVLSNLIVPARPHQTRPHPTGPYLAPPDLPNPVLPDRTLSNQTEPTHACQIKPHLTPPIEPNRTVPAKLNLTSPHQPRHTLPA